MKQSNKILIGIFLLFIGSNFTVQSQTTITSPKGYSPQIGSTVMMLEDLKNRVTRIVQNLTDEQTDFLMDENANSIGAMIMHLAATEVYYQAYTFENRALTKEEGAKWNTAQNLGEKGRQTLKGKPISYYLAEWDAVRKETLRLLKTKDDAWFDAKVKGSSMNNHWAWFHVMEHQANHMGQIVLISKRSN